MLQKHQPESLLWTLLVLQLLAEPSDMLTELQPTAGLTVASALTMHTEAATAGMEPVNTTAAGIFLILYNYSNSRCHMANICKLLVWLQQALCSWDCW